MSGVVYILCASTCLLCSIMLARGYRQNRVPLLFWSALCFLGLFFDNVLLYVDHIMVPDIDLAMWRKVPGLLALVLLLFGLIWESK